MEKESEKTSKKEMVGWSFRNPKSGLGKKRTERCSKGLIG